MLMCVLLSVASPAQEPTFRTSAPVVLVPVTVADRKGKFVETLKAEDFVLLSDGKAKAFHLDSAESVSAPLAIVIAVQTNDISATANLKVRRIGSLIQPLITGDRGRAAVVGYGDTAVLLADFTKDPNVIADAFARTAASQGSNTARQIDAVAYAAHLLEGRPEGERKVLILLGESKDRGSVTPLAEALKTIQQSAVTVYAATWSPYETAFTTKGNDTPNATSNTDLLTGIGELRRLAKRDTARQLVQATGGEKLGFATLKGLEHDITRLGEELHGQYLLSFPAQDAEPGYHRLEVQVKNQHGLKVRARDGFWVAEKTEPKP
jgi:VWFA-related protein